MFQEQINQAVNEISNLQDIQTADLKLLTERYPYCQIAQVMYAKKLHSINNPGFEKQLQKTSAIIYDRNVLFEIIENTPLRTVVSAGFEQEEEIKSEPVQMHHEEIKQEEIIPVVQNIPEEKIIEEAPVMIHENISEEVFDQIISDQENDQIEIKAEEIIQEQPETEISEEPVVIQQEEIKTEEPVIEESNVINDEIKKDEPVMELADLVQSEEPITEDIPEIEEPVENNKPEFEEPLFEMPGYNIERELGTLDEKDEIRIEIQKPVIHEEIIQEPVNQQMPVETQSHSFAAWFQTIGMNNQAKVVELKAEHKPFRQTAQRKEHHPVQEVKEIVKTQEPEVVTEQIAGELAKKSLQFDDRLASETYARILYMQGKYARAIEMYEKLSLLKPAKSDYFAALIEQIKKRK